MSCGFNVLEVEGFTGSCTLLSGDVKSFTGSCTLLSGNVKSFAMFQT
jgi:hypothetical protein